MEPEPLMLNRPSLSYPVEPPTRAVHRSEVSIMPSTDQAKVFQHGEPQCLACQAPQTVLNISV